MMCNGLSPHWFVMVLSQYAPLWDNCKDRANFGGLGSNKMKKPTFGKKNANKKHGADLSPFDWDSTKGDSYKCITRSVRKSSTKYVKSPTNKNMSDHKCKPKTFFAAFRIRQATPFISERSMEWLWSWQPPSRCTWWSWPPWLWPWPCALWPWPCASPCAWPEALPNGGHKWWEDLQETSGGFVHMHSVFPYHLIN